MTSRSEWFSENEDLEQWLSDVENQMGEIGGEVVLHSQSPSWTRKWMEELIVEEPKWKKEALCRGINGNVFFPQRGQSMLPAYKICCGCSVREECFEASTEDNSFGVWAGFTPGERKEIRVSMSKGRSFKEAMEPYDAKRRRKLERAKLKARSVSLFS